MQDNIIPILSLALNLYLIINEARRLGQRMKYRSKRKNDRF